MAAKDQVKGFQYPGIPQAGVGLFVWHMCTNQNSLDPPVSLGLGMYPVTSLRQRREVPVGSSSVPLLHPTLIHYHCMW